MLLVQNYHELSVIIHIIYYSFPLLIQLLMIISFEVFIVFINSLVLYSLFTLCFLYIHIVYYSFPLLIQLLMIISSEVFIVFINSLVLYSLFTGLFQSSLLSL